MFKLCLPLAALLLAGSLTGSVLGAPPLPDVARLRHEHEQEISRALIPQEEALVQQLGLLQREFLLKEDYKALLRIKGEAAMAQQRVQALKAKLAQAPPPLTALIPDMTAVAKPSLGTASPSEKTSLILLPKTAALSGSLQLSPGGEAITAWTTLNATSEWKLAHLPPGGYEVILEYSCPSNEGGRFQISEDFHYLIGTTTSTNGKFMKKNVGTLRIKSGDGKLSLKALSIVEGKSLWQLKSVELARADL